MGTVARVPAARAARPRPPPDAPRATSPTRAEHPRATARAVRGTGGFGGGGQRPARHRLHPQLRTGCGPGTLPRFPAAELVPARGEANRPFTHRELLGAQSERPPAQIPPPRSAPANLNNSVRRREHVQSGALPPAPEILMPRDEPSRESRGGCGTRSHLRPGQRGCDTPRGRAVPRVSPHA